MEYALYVLPYILQVPPRRGKRPSNDEVAFHFLQFHPVSAITFILCGVCKYTLCVLTAYYDMRSAY